MDAIIEHKGQYSLFFLVSLALIQREYVNYEMEKQYL